MDENRQLSVKTLRFVVDSAHEGKLVRDIINCHFRVSAKTLARLKRREDGILVNGERVTVRRVLSEGDLLVLNLGEEMGAGEDSAGLVPVDIPIEVVFEDEDVIVVNKPPFMPTHPSFGHYEDTLANALAYYFREKGKEDFVFRSVNRLDRNTSGLVAVAKNKYAASVLCEYMASGMIKKRYFALLDGVPECRSSRIDTYIRRRQESIIDRVVCASDEKGALHAVTNYRVVGVGGGHSLIKLEPLTGRTHQLRVHMAHLGCPITGDGIYGTESEDISRHALHAEGLSFPSVSDGKVVELCAPVPSDIAALLEKYGIAAEH